MKTRLILSLLATGLIVPPAVADEIVFPTGERRQGRIESVDGAPNRIAFITSSGRIEIPRDRVREIVEQDDATDYAILGNQYLTAGNLNRALAEFQRALSFDSRNAEARAGMEKAQARQPEQQAEAQRTQHREKDSNIQQARELIEQDQHAEAERILQRVLDSNPSPQQREEAQRIQVELYMDWAEHRMDRLDNSGAERYYREVLRLDPNNRRAYDGLLLVLKNSSDPRDRQEVLRAVQSQLNDRPNDLELNRQAADILWSLNRRNEAIPYFLKLKDWSSFYALGYNARLESAMKRRAQDQALGGDIDGAIATYEQLVDVLPETDPTPLFHLRYEQKVRALPADDYDARAALLRDLEAQGLGTLALSEANAILDEAPDNATALQFVRTRAEQSLAEATEAFQTGQFVLARRSAQLFANDPVNQRFPDLVQAASDLMARSQIEAERQAKQAREQARQIAALGDQYLAEARRNHDQLRSADINQRTTGISYRQETVKNARRAIDAYRAALEIDPTLGQLVGGEDLNSKIADAQQLYNVMTQPTIRLPQLPRRPARRR
jgi:tetratricopeptide (TPR) repeat protein